MRSCAQISAAAGLLKELKMNAIVKNKPAATTSNCSVQGQPGNEEVTHYAAQIMAEAWMLQEQALLECPLIYIESFMDAMMGMASLSKADLEARLCGMLPSVRPATIRGMLNLKYGAIA
jgi:hypothetical protein